MKDKMSHIQVLEKEIIEHKNAYYSGNPKISDEEYDSLESKLKEICPESYVLSMVGSLPKSNLPKVRHEKKMLSLEKTYSIDELQGWIKNESVVSTIKLDGISCSLVYNNGHLVMAKTRGNGSLGENITKKCEWLESIPKNISINEDVEVRGEILCFYSDFENLKIEMKRRGLEEPSSPRNISAGLISRKDQIDLSRFLTFKAFDIFIKNKELSYETDKIKILKGEKFKLASYEVHESFNTVNKVIDNAKELMANGEYQLDGIVFTYNNVNLHNKLGETAHHPKYKIAFKFQGESKTTTIKDIFWDISRNGIFTPVAIIEPTELSGAMISRVTLHNFGVVRDNNLKVGDEISIVRSGEVIPKFLSVISSSSNELNIPNLCKYCGSKISIEEIRLVCRNINCPGKIKGQILNYIQKIGIEDLSEKRLEQLINSKLIKKIDDLYRLRKSDLMALDKVKEKLASKLIASIEKSRSVELSVFLSALGLTGGALNKNEKIVQSGFDTIEKVMNLSLDSLIEVDGFAQKSANDYLKSLNSKRELIEILVDLGVNFYIDRKEVKTSSKIRDKKICITGSLNRKRSEIEKVIKESGGIPVKSVTSKTDLLVCNDSNSTSSKYKKAEELNIQIINEEDLFELF